jgi:hypothetical protein
MRAAGDLRKLILGAGALAASLGSIVGLVITLWPHHGPPAHGTGRVTAVRVREPNVTRGDYCRRFYRGDPRKCLRHGAARDVGNVFEVRLVVTGYSGICCHLTWSLYDANNRKAVRDYQNVPAVNDIAPGESEATDSLLWVPDAAPGDYYVTFDLFDKQGPVDDRSSRVFSTVAAPA